MEKPYVGDVFEADRSGTQRSAGAFPGGAPVQAQ